MQRPGDALNGVIERALGRRVLECLPLTGGCIAPVWRVRTEGGPDVVAKGARGRGGTLEPEAFMLRWLAGRTGLPVPRVLHASPEALLMELVPGSGALDERAERHAADLLADLHGHSADRFGFERDTVIGPLAQPNTWTASWMEFFAQHRLRKMADGAAGAGRITRAARDRVWRLADGAGSLLREPASPALVHGDVWAGNILAADGRVTAFLDPAIYYAHPEVELAYLSLFGTVGPAFFERYKARRGIEPGFFERRAAVYNLYPLLVHARLFGGGYEAMVERSLTKAGY